MCSQAAVVTETVGTVLAVPTVGLMMRFSPLISLVDEYTFYAYHQNANYDKGAKFMIRLCSDWTDNKWVPSFLENLSHWMNNLNQAITDTTIDGETINKPNKFR